MRAVATLAVVACVLSANLLARQAGKQDLEMQACGPRDQESRYVVRVDTAKHPTPEPPAGRALIYVLRAASFRRPAPADFAVDGDWQGANLNDNYFFVTAEPGEHGFCSVYEGDPGSRSALAITVEAGKTYYLQQHAAASLLPSHIRLERVSEAEGKKKIVKMRLASWGAKYAAPPTNALGVRAYPSFF